MGPTRSPRGLRASPWDLPSPAWISLLLIVIWSASSRAAWQDRIAAKLRITQIPPDLVHKFRGNPTESDYFKLLEQDGENLLVGARNMVYNVSISTLQLQKKLEWFSNETDVGMCNLKGKSREVCQNYIRVLAKKSDTVILVCGTNSYRPRCRDYTLSPDGEYVMKEEKPGEGLCPFDPNHNSTAIFADGDLYVATVGQLTGADPLIYRKPLRTEQFDLKHLNAPNFVSSIHHGDYVYFFFRESAVEYINCGKTIYSRVARVCTNDKGGPHKFQQRWTSFLKARLNCSMGGDIPFYFNEIQSTSPIVEGTYNGREAKLIYSVFTTPLNSISGSAVCAFRLEDIQRVFEGSFKGQEDMNSNWLPVVNSKVPEPRPGQCVNNSMSLPDVTLNFISNHPLMDQAVPSYWGKPIIIHAGFDYRFTYIAVDPQVEAVNGKKYDVLFIGTDVGRVLKAVNTAGVGGEGTPVVVEDSAVFREDAPVTNLLVHHTLYSARLVVVTHSEIQSIPLFVCDRYAKTCGECVGLRDPYCAWDLDNSACINPPLRSRQRDSFVQSIEEGWDHRCGQGRPPPSAAKVPHRSPHQFPGGTGAGGSDDPSRTAVRPLGGHEVGVPGASVHGSQGPAGSAQYYTAETLAIAVTTSIVSSLVVGFISGYIFSRRCRNDEDPDDTCQQDDYSRYLDRGGDLHTEGFLPPAAGRHHNNTKPINLVLNVPPKNGKNANSSADNKPVQKVKKVYL